MSSSTAEPTAEERRKHDEERRAKEKEEQALLPYKWIQTLQDVDITVPVEGKFKGRDIVVVFTKMSLKVGVKGQEPIIEV